MHASCLTRRDLFQYGAAAAVGMTALSGCSSWAKGKSNRPQGFRIGVCDWNLDQAMDEIDYQGWIQIEGAQPLGLVKSYQQDVAYLRSIFPATT